MRDVISIFPEYASSLEARAELVLQYLLVAQSIARSSEIPFYRGGEYYYLCRWCLKQDTSITESIGYCLEQAGKELMEINAVQESEPLFENLHHQLLLQALLDKQSRPALTGLKELLHRAQKSQSIHQHAIKHNIKTLLNYPSNSIQLLKQLQFLRLTSELKPVSIQQRASGFALQSELLQQIPNIEPMNLDWLLELIHLLKEGASQLAIWGELVLPGVTAVALVEDLPEELDVLILWEIEDIPFELIRAKLKTGALVVYGQKRSSVIPESFRSYLQTHFHSSVFLIDRAAFNDCLIAYWYQDKHFETQDKLLVSMPPYSLVSLGGLERLVFQLVRQFKHQKVRTDISLANRLDLNDYDSILVIGPKHEGYKLSDYQLTKVPKLFMPFPHLFEENLLVSEKIYREAKQSSDLNQYLSELELDTLRQNLPRTLTHDTLQLQQLAQVSDYALVQSRIELNLLDDESYPHDFIFNGIDSTAFQEASAELFKQAYSLSGFILCVGRINYFKNQLLLAQALKESSIPLVLIGAIEDPDYFQLCLKTGAPIIHIQSLSLPLFTSAYKAAKLLVVPSVSEVFPNVAIEAAYAHCPVVATAFSGQKEWFKDSFYYINPFDITQIRETIQVALKADNSDKINQAHLIAQELCLEWPLVAKKVVDTLRAIRMK